MIRNLSLVCLIVAALWGCFEFYKKRYFDYGVESTYQDSKVSTLDQVYRTVERIKPGMSEEQVIDILKPFLVRSAYTFADGSGYYESYLHLVNELELVLEMNAIPSSVVTRVRPIDALSKWNGIFYDVDEEDISTALGIAVSLIDTYKSEGKDLAKIFSISAAGRIVSDDTKTVRLTSSKGAQIAYEVTATGRYVSHRLVELDFVREGKWNYHVIVDMDDLKVVPSDWTPSSFDINKAKKIARTSIEDFIGSSKSEKKVKVRALGAYDYGPTRRIVVLFYSKPIGLGEMLRSVSVDIDNGVIHE